MTFDDPEGPFRTVLEHVRLSESTTKIWMKIDYNISDDDVAQWL